MRGKSSVHTTRGNISIKTRKTRKTFTLSRESIELLEQLKNGRKGKAEKSTSAVLDDILKSLDSQRKRLEVERKISAYYDSLTDEQVNEDGAWGDFAFAQITPEAE